MWRVPSCPLLQSFCSLITAPKIVKNHCLWHVYWHHLCLLFIFLHCWIQLFAYYFTQIFLCKRDFESDITWMRITFSVPLMTKYPPGSIGHSLSFAISAGVLFVRTQFELRNMIGILKTHRFRNISLIVLIRRRSEIASTTK